MNPVVLIAALIGAVAILLIFWGLFGARRDEVQGIHLPSGLFGFSY